jgi:putative transposase
MKEYNNANGKYYSLIYHIVFCARYRRKIFLIEGLEDRFKAAVEDVCNKNGMILYGIDCHIDYCYITVGVSPELSVAQAIAKIKGYTGRILLAEVDVFFKNSKLMDTKLFSLNFKNSKR